MKTLFIRTLTGIVYLSILAFAFFLPLPARLYTLPTIFTIFLCISLFEYLNLTQKFPVPKNKMQRVLRRWILPVAWIILPVLLLEYWCIGLDATNIMVALFIILCMNDTMAYLFGSLLGKHKIWKRVSPKKSWEGFLGGLLSTMVACRFITQITYFQNDIIKNPPLWMGFAFVVIIAGTFGDFAESMVKRYANEKDSGAILPGHGGILDRIDSMLFAVPAGFFYYYLVEIFYF
jgi:phosphatidate cytidylyltransferase